MSCRWLPFAAAALALPQLAHMEKEGADEGSGWHLLGLSNRRRVFFKYEKRIRELSPPDKVVDQNEWACAPLFREADGVVEGDQGRYRFLWPQIL